MHVYICVCVCVGGGRRGQAYQCVTEGEKKARQGYYVLDIVSQDQRNQVELDFHANQGAGWDSADSLCGRFTVMAGWGPWG